MKSILAVAALAAAVTFSGSSANATSIHVSLGGGYYGPHYSTPYGHSYHAPGYSSYYSSYSHYGPYYRPRVYTRPYYGYGHGPVLVSY